MPATTAPSRGRRAEVCDSPVYWFALMEAGKNSGDFDLAAKAKRKLERLGVRVIYRNKGGDHAA